MPPNCCAGNGHGLPSSRSACTNFAPGMDCGSRSTAMTSNLLKTLACLPEPQATSSTGPRLTSGAQRTTHGDGVSGCACAMLLEKPPQDRAVAALLVLAIAADRKIRLPRKRRQHAKQPLRGRRLHLALVGPGEALPVLVRERDHLGRRREIGKPDVVVIEPGVVALFHSARRAAHRAEAQALALGARRAEAHHPDHARELFSNACAPGGSSSQCCFERVHTCRSTLMPLVSSSVPASSAISPRSSWHVEDSVVAQRGQKWRRIHRPLSSERVSKVVGFPVICTCVSRKVGQTAKALPVARWQNLQWHATVREGGL